ncbi:hypothetical protein [Kineosporia mesophila]|uniref:hypothetical protein n=1 Tax=Kineosporia mesophila TaxID=566012 RepID=UPI001E5C85D4|nr:hypothetical protein [Kineosporia mesophila]MCD5354662.1 hypothetical protein [Kineosporia mesophila]
MREIVGLTEMSQVEDLFVSIGGGDRLPATIDLMSAPSKAGHYVTGAFPGTVLAGAGIGFFHAPAEAGRHSHIAGVAGTPAGRGAGHALKMRQRDWAPARGVTESTWTFDPLIGRNAYFDLARLGARAVEYLPDFYGPMGDDINGTDASDRLRVRWDLLDPRRTRKLPGRRSLSVFSGRQNEADASRVETVLGRRVPEPVRELLARRGVFRDLHRSHEPILVDPVTFAGVVQIPRLAIAVRAGDEVLGSIWATVTGPLNQARCQTFPEAAKLVALHMFRVRSGADVQRRMRTDRLGTALTGGAGATDAPERLGLARSPLLVLGVVGSVTGSDEQERLGDAFAMHLSAVLPRAVAATIGGVTYGLVPVRPDQAEDAARLARDFLDRVGAGW